MEWSMHCFWCAHPIKLLFVNKGMVGGDGGGAGGGVVEVLDL